MQQIRLQISTKAPACVTKNVLQKRSQLLKSRITNEELPIRILFILSRNLSPAFEISPVHKFSYSDDL